MSCDVLKELEEELRESLRKRFLGVPEAVLKKVRVWVDEKQDGYLGTNAAFLVSKATGKPLPEVALTVGAGWLADDPKLGRVECYYDNGVVVKISRAAFYAKRATVAQQHEDEVREFQKKIDADLEGYWTARRAVTSDDMAARLEMAKQLIAKLANRIDELEANQYDPYERAGEC